MKKIITIDKTVGIYRILGECSLMKVGKDERGKVFGMLKRLKVVADEFDVLEKFACERLRPDNWEELVEKYQTDKSVLNGYFAEVEDALKEDRERKVELEFDAVSEDALTEMCGDKVKISVLMELIELLCSE